MSKKEDIKRFRETRESHQLLMKKISEELTICGIRFATLEEKREKLEELEEMEAIKNYYPEYINS